MKKLMIMGAGIYQVPLIKRAKEMQKLKKEKAVHTVLVQTANRNRTMISFRFSAALLRPHRRGPLLRLGQYRLQHPPAPMLQPQDKAADANAAAGAGKIWSMGILHPRQIHRHRVVPPFIRSTDCRAVGIGQRRQRRHPHSG